MPSAAMSNVRFRALPSNSGLTNFESTTEVSNVEFLSHQNPPLAAGEYEVSFVQSIEPPNGFSGPEKPFKSSQKFTVQGPTFKLDPVNDIDSVFPAPGHSEHANTLPHIVFSDPILPWERKLGDGSKTDEFNSTPWLALLTFTEEELKLSDAEISALDFKPGPRTPTPTLSFDMTAKELMDVGPKGFNSALNLTGDRGHLPNGSRDADPVSAIFLKPELFKALFSEHSETAPMPGWTGKQSAKRYAYFAHIQRIHGHHMASTSPGDAHKRDHSIVFSHRVGVIAPTQPTNVIVHLVSLTDVEEINVGANTKRVGLISLHSWTWMAIPSDHVNFIHTMTELSKAESIQPLRMTDRFLASFVDMKSTGPNPKTDATQRLVNRLMDGYIIKKHTLNTAKQRSSLLRGPLCPQIPSVSWDRPSSQNGNDLEVEDEVTKLPDVSYKVAWQLGRLLAIGDNVFVKSLLWLRGKIHSEAVRLTKEDVDNSYTGMEEYLNKLLEAVQGITKAHDDPAVTTDANAFYRWYDGAGTPGYANNVAPVGLTLPKICCSSQYVDYVRKVATELTSTREKPGETNSTKIYNETNDPLSHEWAKVLEWILDILFTGKIPLHYLVPDPESIPAESIRTFFVDQTWLECVIDGALSLANHLEPDDDNIKKELKRRVNAYLATPLGDGPDAPLPRLPRWGFFLRSTAISAFPDLRVEVPTKGKSSQSDILLMQRVGEDVLMFLLDRIPGEDEFSDVILSRPGHQNGFTLGDGETELTHEELTISFRRLPNSPATYEYEKEEGVHMKTWSSDGKQGGKPVFDWNYRTIIMPEFARQCIDLVGGPADDGKYFSWDPSQRGGIPSSLIATQLSKSVFRLKIGSDPDQALKTLLSDPSRNPWKMENGARRIYVGDEVAVGGASNMKVSALEEVKIEAVTLPVAPLLSAHRLQIPAPLPAQNVMLTTDHMNFGTFPEYPGMPGYRYGTGRNEHDIRPRTAVYPLHHQDDRDNWAMSSHGMPMDLVIQCEGHARDSFWSNMPAEWHFLIPIRLQSYPPDKDDSLRNVGVLLQIPGDRDHLELPTIEPIYAGPRWIYDMSVCYGGRWNEEGDRNKYVADKAKHWVSYLWIRARTAARWTKDDKHYEKQGYNLSFLLKGVRIDPIPLQTYKQVEVNIIGFEAFEMGENWVPHTCVVKKIKVYNK